MARLPSYQRVLVVIYRSFHREPDGSDRRFCCQLQVSVKNRSSGRPRIYWRQIVKHAPAAAARQLMPPSQQAIGVVLLTGLMMIC